MSIFNRMNRVSRMRFILFQVEIMMEYLLFTFLKICETHSFTEASRELHISQSTVSLHIRKIEEYYGVRLFDFKHKTLTLTPQGEILRKFAIDEKAGLEILRRTILNSFKEQASIRFGATLSVGEFFMPEILSSYMKEFPQHRISMLVDNTATLIGMLDNGSIDFAIVEGAFNKEKFTWRCLAEVPFIGICSKQSPLADQTIKLSDIADEFLIVREEGSGTRAILENLLATQNLSISRIPHMEIGNMNAITHLVADGHGITFLYKPVAAEGLRNGRLAQLNIENVNIVREFSFICHRRAINYDMSITFLNYCKNFLETKVYKE